MIKHPFHIVFKGAASRVLFHIFMSYAWLACMVVIPFMHTFQGASNLPALLIMEVSLYANFATEFGSIDAARASAQTEVNIDNVTINET